jgi:tRNA modification GTPase
MPIDKIETIAKMIESKNQKSIQILTKNLSGHLQLFLDEIRKSLVLLLAHSEVSIDYGEEDLPENLIKDILSKIDEIINKFNQVLKNTSYSKKIIEGNAVAIIGKPNVGKSSLLNTILGTNRAIISTKAGTTRDTIEELIEFQGHLIKIIDTAGIRDTNDDIESIGIEKSLESIKKADTILAIFDISNTLDENDLKVLNAIKDKKDKSIIIFNKQDLENKINLKEFKTFPHQASISAKNNNIDNLINSLTNILNQNNLTNELSLSSQRQENLIRKTKENLTLAKENIQNEDLEIFSYNITESLELISQVTSNYDYSELQDTMFEGFCLGK